MAEEVEMIPVAGAEPPKAASTLKLAPVARKPAVGATAALKPGLKLPPKPGLAAGLKLPQKPGATISAARPGGLKLPPKPGLATGLKLPPKPGATVAAMRPGLKLPTKPVIRKPGETVATAPVPKPVPAPTPVPKPMETLKSVTQKLKGITQEIPQQAILHRTGIIADGAMSESQKEAAKHKTARISLADAMGVAPVKDEIAPMKTIRIKRPIDIPGSAPAPAAAAPAPAAAAAPAAAPAAPAAEPAAPAPAPAAPAATMTQRKTLKIARPGGGAVRPTGKFGVRRPASQATTVAKVAPAAAAAPAAPAADGAVADIPDIPNLPAAAPVPAPVADEGSGGVWILSVIVQFAACVAIGALAWFLYTNTQTQYF